MPKTTLENLELTQPLVQKQQLSSYLTFFYPSFQDSKAAMGLFKMSTMLYDYLNVISFLLNKKGLYLHWTLNTMHYT